MNTPKTVEEIEMLARASGLKGSADAWTILRSAIQTAIDSAAQPAPAVVAGEPGACAMCGALVQDQIVQPLPLRPTGMGMGEDSGHSVSASDPAAAANPTVTWPETP